MRDGLAYGIELEGDFCAEHESGILPLANMFEITDEGVGIERFQAKKLPVFFTKTGVMGRKPAMMLACNARGIDSLKRARTITDAAALCSLTGYNDFFSEDEILSVAWDDYSFGILAVGKSQVTNLKHLTQLLLIRPFYLYVTKARPVFCPFTLRFVSEDGISKEERDEMREKDENTQRLMKVVAKTKVYKKLERANLGFYALSPRWEFETEKGQSKWPIRFFLNPHQQDKHNHGWFTVEDLIAWTKGKGPIIKASTTPT